MAVGTLETCVLLVLGTTYIQTLEFVQGCFPQTLPGTLSCWLGAEGVVEKKPTGQ